MRYRGRQPQTPPGRTAIEATAPRSRDGRLGAWSLKRRSAFRRGSDERDGQAPAEARRRIVATAIVSTQACQKTKAAARAGARRACLAEQVWARRGRHARRDHEAGLPRLGPAHDRGHGRGRETAHFSGHDVSLSFTRATNPFAFESVDAAQTFYEQHYGPMIKTHDRSRRKAAGPTAAPSFASCSTDWPARTTLDRLGELLRVGEGCECLHGSVLEAHQLRAVNSRRSVGSREPRSHCGACPVDRRLVVV